MIETCTLLHDHCIIENVSRKLTCNVAFCHSINKGDLVRKSFRIVYGTQRQNVFMYFERGRALRKIAFNGEGFHVKDMSLNDRQKSTTLVDIGRIINMLLITTCCTKNGVYCLPANSHF